MERQYHLDFEFCCFFEQRQHLAAVLADDVGVITPCLGQQVEIHIVLIRVKATVERAKSSKRIC